MQSQTAWALSQLRHHGRVTRNQALRRNITRLAARIADLKEAGHGITGTSVKTRGGKDYEYSLGI